MLRTERVEKAVRLWRLLNWRLFQAPISCFFRRAYTGTFGRELKAMTVLYTATPIIFGQISLSPFPEFVDTRRNGNLSKAVN